MAAIAKGTRNGQLPPMNGTVRARRGPDIRVGTVIRIEGEPQRMRLLVGFGTEIGLKRATIGAFSRPAPAELVGSRVCAVVNPPFGRAGSEDVLILAMADRAGQTVLICPDQKVADGGKLL